MQVLPLPKILTGEGNAKPGHWSHHSDCNSPSKDPTIGGTNPWPSPLSPLPQVGEGNVGNVRMGRRHQYKLRRAREFRKRPTAAERRAWELLRDRRILGVKFRRQHCIRGFVVDFYCHELRLVLEIDGPVHHTPEQKAYDAERTAILEGLGLRVVRIPNETVARETLLAVLSPPSRVRERGDRG